MPLIEITDARHVAGYRIWLRFSDGVEGEVDLESALHGEVFAPLRDPAAFTAFHLEHGTIGWANRADLAPAFLYDRLETAPHSPPPSRGS
jgi:hypothetical protein